MSIMNTKERAIKLDAFKFMTNEEEKYRMQYFGDPWPPQQRQQLYADWGVPKEERLPVVRLDGYSRILEDQIDRIIQNGPVTIVMWTDGAKTVVRKADDEEYNLYAAVAQAVLKKLIGSTSRAHKVIKKKTVVQKPKEKKIKEIEVLQNKNLDNVQEVINYGGKLNETND